MQDYDLVVVGSGAGGLSAAVTAATLGLKVVVLEKEPVFGGTSAWSGGWMWIPRNPLARRAGIEEPAEGPMNYLREELGDRFNEKKISAYLENGPEMVAFFETRTALRFIDGNKIPDFHGRSEYAGLGGRSVCAAPYDGRALGPLVRRLRPPLDEITLRGLPIASGQDMAHFFNATRSLASALYVAKRMLRFACDKIQYGRAMHLVNGNALVARLLKSAQDAGVMLVPEAHVSRLLQDGGPGGRVTGVEVSIDGQRQTIRASRGVVMACGGFPHDVARRKAALPHTPTGFEHWSAAPDSNTGDGIRLAEAAGAYFDDTLAHPVAWAPVSLVRRPDGRLARFPHLVERGKPGVIAVMKNGKRFTDEADSYHDFVASLIAATPDGEPLQAWLICDHAFQRRYGLGFSKPAPLPVGPYVKSGYLQRAATLEQLAQQCGIDAAALRDTVATYNRHAANGEDPEFGKGSTPYNRVQGDATRTPNPCLAPIENGPYYALRLYPGSLGTFAGIRTDESGRATIADGAVIEGLYATGADSASVMEGYYPAGGITLGPAVTFGYIIGKHAAHQGEAA